MIKQLSCFFTDCRRLVGKNKARYIYIWLSRQFVAVALYRFERGMYLSFGKVWQVARIVLLPILNLFYFYSNSEIHYQADVGPGLLILHSSLGNVISGRSTIGKNLTLAGGNVIGNRGYKNNVVITIGDSCTMGVHSVIMGPLTLGKKVTIGACACVMKDAGDNAVLVGVPAKNVSVQA